MPEARIKPRNDASTNWTLKNPTLAFNEIGFESNSGRFKIGDGSTRWTSLGYFDNIAPKNHRSYTVATVPNAALWEGATIYVSDESSGGTLAFSDGTSWRRVQDRNVIS